MKGKRGERVSHKIKQWKVSEADPDDRVSQMMTMFMVMITIMMVTIMMMTMVMMINNDDGQ